MPTALQYTLHRDHPEAYEMARIAEALRDGALILYPTDTIYALGCLPSQKSAISRLRALKGDTGKTITKPLTMLCPSLTDIAHYAHVLDRDYKLMRALTPGPYTFLLNATKEVPKLVLNPKRKTAGLRIPDHPLCRQLLARTGGLLVSSSAKLPGGEEARSLDELVETLEGQVDLVVLTEQKFHNNPSTMLDLTGTTPQVLREGLGMDRLRPFLAGE